MHTAVEWLVGMQEGKMDDVFVGILEKEPDFQPLDLKRIELWCRNDHPMGPEILRCLAFYFGETIVQNIPGSRWEVQEDRLRTTVETVQGDLQIDPMVFTDRVVHAAADGLYSFFLRVAAVQQGLLPIEQIDNPAPLSAQVRNRLKRML